MEKSKEDGCELLAYEADMVPFELPRLVFGFQKYGWRGGGGRSTVPSTSSDIMLKNDQNYITIIDLCINISMSGQP